MKDNLDEDEVAAITDPSALFPSIFQTRVLFPCKIIRPRTKPLLPFPHKSHSFLLQTIQLFTTLNQAKTILSLFDMLDNQYAGVAPYINACVASKVRNPKLSIAMGGLTQCQYEDQEMCGRAQKSVTAVGDISVLDDV